MSDLDYNLRACLIHNPQDGITEETISSVLAVWEGENEGEDWRWVVSLVDGRFGFIEGGCDYTGWDCVSYARSLIKDDPEHAAACAIFCGDVHSNDVYFELMRQIEHGKKETWREQKDREFGVTSGRS